MPQREVWVDLTGRPFSRRLDDTPDAQIELNRIDTSLFFWELTFSIVTEARYQFPGFNMSFWDRDRGCAVLLAVNRA